MRSERGIYFFINTSMQIRHKLIKRMMSEHGFPTALLPDLVVFPAMTWPSCGSSQQQLEGIIERKSYFLRKKFVKTFQDLLYSPDARLVRELLDVSPTLVTERRRIFHKTVN